MDAIASQKDKVTVLSRKLESRIHTAGPAGTPYPCGRQIIWPILHQYSLDSSRRQMYTIEDIGALWLKKDGDMEVFLRQWIRTVIGSNLDEEL